MVHLLLAMLAASCGEHPRDLLPTSPTVAARPTVAASPTSVASVTSIRGSVSDTAFRALPGARVEVLNGDSAGVMAVADASGVVTLSGRFTKETLFRATADNHATHTQSWNCPAAVCGSVGGAVPSLWIRLNPLEPPVDISGTYTLTIVTDAECVGIPANLHERTYGASISAQSVDDRPAPPGFDLTLTDDSMIGRYPGFAIGVAGARLRFDMHGGHDPVIVERFGSESISVSGYAAATVAGSQPSVITAAMDGWIEYVSPHGGIINCTSTAHQIILRRLS